MAGISTLGPGPSFKLPGAAIPLDSGFEGSDESSDGDDIVVVDLSNKKLERQLVFTSVQSQDQQQTTVSEDGSKQSNSENTSVNNDSETAQEGAQEGGGGEDSAEDDGPPPTPPNLSALDNPFFTRPSRVGGGSSRTPFSSSRSSSPFAGGGSGNSFLQGTGLGGSNYKAPGSSGVGGVFPGLGIGVGNNSFDILGDERPAEPRAPARASETRAPLPSQISESNKFADSELSRANDLATRLSAQFGFSGGILDLFA
ncbi:MAG: hypothetical protein O3B01_20925 [Planctomycetota bacterium]|nr:hypothetical protein [Planctomycetota bacterium]MDA1141037.1 hypothetical protein [Planctomycetota bacterium]